MSQSRFSIVLVGVSALLRRPLVSRLRPADGERSPWMVFTARVGRFDSGGRWAGWSSGSLLPLFGTHRIGDCPRRAASSAFRFGDCPRRVGLRAHCFRFSACTDSELPSAGWPSGSLLPIFGTRRFGVAAGRLAFGLIASEIAIWRVGLRVHCFRFSARTDSELPLGEFVLPPSASEIALGGLVLPLGGWPSGSLLPLFGTHRFGDCPRRVGLRAHCFRFSACADPHRRAAEARTDGAQRHDNCFTSKHLSQHVNLPHRTP